jgi:acyl dehydratase
VTTSVNLARLSTLIGRRLGPTASIEISQNMINEFGQITLDTQWIHVDPSRAKESQFGGTIAHGFLSLSLLSHVMYELLLVEDTRMAINYGLNKVRFPSALKSGSQLRGYVELLRVNANEKFTDMACSVSLIADGEKTPCCVAESLTRFIPSPVVHDEISVV